MSDSDGTNPGWVDLGARALGGMVLAASDEFFAPKERLLEPAPPLFDPHAYSDRGKLMDGWESRRRRSPWPGTHASDGSKGNGTYDWVVVRLGVPGMLREILVNTAFFRGNYPEACAVEGCFVDDDPSSEEIASLSWTPVLERRELQGDSEQVFGVDRDVLVTHVRFAIFPDGGVARLRLRGEPLPDLREAVVPGGAVEVAGTIAGGRAVACSDAFFSSPHNLLAPGSPIDMGGGWETRRRRGAGHDWVMVRLAAEAQVGRIEVDTTHFKGNYPHHCTVDIAHVPDPGLTAQPSEDDWHRVVTDWRMRAHARQAVSLDASRLATHVRLGIHPDGGVARLRVFGVVSDAGWRHWGVRWLNALSEDRASEVLYACCSSSVWVSEMIRHRPFADFSALQSTADHVWQTLPRKDWLEAFAAHPRIGERSRERWASQEQAGTQAASDDTLAALEEGNRIYEERFGHVFLICATGMEAGEMLASLRRRLGHDADSELNVAAEEQRKITRLRLQKMVKP